MLQILNVNCKPSFSASVLFEHSIPFTFNDCVPKEKVEKLRVELTDRLQSSLFINRTENEHLNAILKDFQLILINEKIHSTVNDTGLFHGSNRELFNDIFQQIIDFEKQKEKA